MKLIMNVDDVGIHPAVGRAVSQLLDKGLVTCASVVANGMDIGVVQQLEGVDIGVHLDILRGQPISHWQHVNTIVDNNGSFLGSPSVLFGLYARGKVSHDEVEKEWSAQIERVLDMGVKPSYLSSYKHVHAWPSLARMAGDLAKKYGIGWVRKPEDCKEISRLDKEGLEGKFLKVCGMFTRETTGVNWTEFFWPIDLEPHRFSPAEFAAHIRSCKQLEPSSVVEICCHPGITVSGDPAIPSFYDPTLLASVWNVETKSLLDDDWHGVLDDLGLELCRMSDLG